MPDSKRPADAVERLYIYWLASTVLLLLIAIIVILFARGAVARTRQLEDRVVVLEQTVEELRAPTASPAQPAPPPAQPAPNQPAEPAPPRETRPPVAPPARTEVPTTPALPPLPPESAVQAQLRTLVQSDPVTIYALTDPGAARELVSAAWTGLERADWSGDTWSGLAVLARLIQQSRPAEAFAQRAADANAPLAAYWEVSTRVLLARRRATDALQYAQSLLQSTNADPTAVVLLADALYSAGQIGPAVEVLRALDNFAALHVADKLRLARLCVDLEYWPELHSVLATIDNVPEALTPERNFLYAVSKAHSTERSDLTEALAIFDYLLANPPAPARHNVPWPVPTPDEYDIRVWRGVTLANSGQADAARETLGQAAAANPGRPEAPFQLGIVEMQRGNYQAAREYLNNAVARSARMVPAWEALALLELDAGNVDAALSDLAEALKVNPRRASAHFLQAIAYAKRSQPDEARQALEATFALDPSYLDKACQTDVILRLFSADELAAMVPGGAQ
jgi:tetratricopeptide (TPR) repeat protein